MNSCKPSGQAGITLIELLVSLVIGLTVSTVAASLIGGVMSSRDKVSGNVDLQETNYFVSQSLRQILVQAGYRALDSNMGSTVGAFPMPDANAFFAEVNGQWEQGQFIKATSQSLSVRYGGDSRADGTADNSIYDCLGTPVAADEQVVTTISLLNQELICTTGIENDVMIGADSGTRVENMRIQVGVDDDADGSADRYILSSVASQADLLSTVALEIRLLLASEDNTLDYSKPYEFAGQSYTPGDKRARRETVVMVSLRNVSS